MLRWGTPTTRTFMRASKEQGVPISRPILRHPFLAGLYPGLTTRLAEIFRGDGGGAENDQDERVALRPVQQRGPAPDATGALRRPFMIKAAWKALDFSAYSRIESLTLTLPLVLSISRTKRRTRVPRRRAQKHPRASTRDAPRARADHRRHPEHGAVRASRSRECECGRAVRMCGGRERAGLYEALRRGDVRGARGREGTVGASAWRSCVLHEDQHRDPRSFRSC